MSPFCAFVRRWRLTFGRKLTLLAHALGPYFVDIFGMIKLGEHRRYQAVVPPLDLEWYLGTV